MGICRRDLLIAGACAGVAALPLRGQTVQSPAQAATHEPPAATSHLSYDVVSIKPDKSGSGRVSININDDTFSASNVSLKMLVADAYGTKEDLIFGLPGWGESEHFDLQAKIVDPDPTALKRLRDEERSSMLKPVLADRFHLKVHTETKVLPVYNLVLAKAEPKFKEVTVDDGAGTKLNGVGRGGMMMRNTVLTGHAVKMDMLTNVLARRLHRTVIDKTGLTGLYDLQLDWTPGDGTDTSPESLDASLLTALQEQLGLKLESSKGPVKTLVVDHAEMPVED